MTHPLFNIDDVVPLTREDIQAVMDRAAAISKEPRPAPCPLCHSTQIQVCIDYNNRSKDWCRCRECKCQAPAVAWNKGQEQLR